MSLNDEIESYFDLWKYKKNYLSFDELRSHWGFTYIKAWNYSFDAKIESIDDFFVNREMILNMILVVLLEEAQIEAVLWNMEWPNHSPIYPCGYLEWWQSHL